MPKEEEYKFKIYLNELKEAVEKFQKENTITAETPDDSAEYKKMLDMQTQLIKLGNELREYTKKLNFIKVNEIRHTLENLPKLTFGNLQLPSVKGPLSRAFIETVYLPMMKKTNQVSYGKFAQKFFSSYLTKKKEEVSKLILNLEEALNPNTKPGITSKA